MPLETYDRGGKWWARGYVEYDGQRITGYIRESTGASTEAGANRWAQDFADRERRRHVVGDEGVFTFADAVMLYTATPEMAAHLIPIVVEIGDRAVRDISPALIRSLGPKLYPNNATDSWRRWVVTPARAVINNAHDAGKCPPIRVKGYSEEERIKQDQMRAKPSRIEKTPGDWDWLLQFRQHANRYNRALSLFMFITGARIGQAIVMHPDKHLDLQNGRVCVPGAKGSADRWLTVPMQLIVELANLPGKCPRGYPRKKSNLRVFGYATRQSPLKSWKHACMKAGIAYLPPHSAGRHGFGQEFNVRQPVDEKAAGKFGGWRDTALMKRTYTHSENADGKILAAASTGLEQAEIRTGLKLLKAG